MRDEVRFIPGWIAPYVGHPKFVRGKTCYMCGEAECRESMPHGNHPDWIAFVAMAADPNDPWASEGSK